MKKPARLPETGYNLDGIYAPHLSLQTVEPQKEGGVGGFLFAWDWAFVTEKTFEVRLQVGLQPARERREEVRVTLVGRFSPLGEDVPLKREEFVRFHAPAILMPYVREAISTLTSKSFYGPVFLPPINMRQVMEQQEPKDATGFKQLAERSGKATK